MSLWAGSFAHDATISRSRCHDIHHLQHICVSWKGARTARKTLLNHVDVYKEVVLLYDDPILLGFGHPWSSQTHRRPPSDSVNKLPSVQAFPVPYERWRSSAVAHLFHRGRNTTWWVFLFCSANARRFSCQHGWRLIFVVWNALEFRDL